MGKVGFRAGDIVFCDTHGDNHVLIPVRACFKRKLRYVADVAAFTR